MTGTVRRLKINKRLEGQACGHCGDALQLGAEGAVCEACNTPHHASCWDEKMGCGGPRECPNIPLTTIPEPAPGPKTPKLKPGEGVCPNCGDVVEGFCYRCSMTVAAGSEGIVADYSGTTETVQEAKDAVKYALIGIFCLGFFFGYKAYQSGSEAKRRIALNPNLEGAGLATFGQVLGIIDIVLWVSGFFFRIASI